MYTSSMSKPAPPASPVPGPLARSWMDRGAFDLQSFYRAVVVDDVASQGTTLVDADGNSFLDVFGSFALQGLGFNHPRLLQVARSDAFARAAANPTSTPFVTTAEWLAFMEDLPRFAPPGASHAFFVDAGGEGVDNAIKTAFIVHGEARRVAAGQPKNPLELPADQQAGWMANKGTDAVIISFDGAFHGRGLGPLSATHSKLMHKADLPAFPWPVVPFPALRWPRERYEAENLRAEAASLAVLEHVLETHAGRVAAILVEPMQSEGGDRQARPEFFRRLQELAGQAGAAVIFDEVQVGMGVTGTIWAHEQFDLPRPAELVCFGKKMQMGGFFSAPSHDVRQFGRMYQTRNGDRARGMLARATLHALVEDGLLQAARDVGAAWLTRLVELERLHPTLVSQARGWGLLLSFDLPTPALRDELLRRATAHGLMATYTGSRSVRMRPHFVGTVADADFAFHAFDAALREMSG
jgi:4-aminobutyrate aminotransferase / (S)-3-amino-2-methylpropionate transaminase